MPFKISYGQSYYMIFNKSQIFKKWEGDLLSLIVDMVQFVHLKYQNYRVKSIFLISKSKMLLRYKSCIVVAKRQCPLFLLFGRKHLRWSKTPTTHSVDPDISGPVFAIFKLLFRGYNVACKCTKSFLKCEILGYILSAFSKLDITGLILLFLLLE